MAAIAGLLAFMGDVTSYETVASAREQQGKTVTVIARLETGSLRYDPAVNPNYLAFIAKDTLGQSMPVAYYFEKPVDIEKSERIVLKGKMENGIFQIRDKSGILLKCPSKYKDQEEASRKKLQETVRR